MGSTTRCPDEPLGSLNDRAMLSVAFRCHLLQATWSAAGSVLVVHLRNGLERVLVVVDSLTKFPSVVRNLEMVPFAGVESSPSLAGTPVLEVLSPVDTRPCVVLTVVAQG